MEVPDGQRWPKVRFDRQRSLGWTEPVPSKGLMQGLSEAEVARHYPKGKEMYESGRTSDVCKRPPVGIHELSKKTPQDRTCIGYGRKESTGEQPQPRQHPAR